MHFLSMPSNIFAGFQEILFHFLVCLAFVIDVAMNFECQYYISETLTALIS